MPGNKLSGAKDRHKIKLRGAGYRLASAVRPKTAGLNSVCYRIQARVFSVSQIDVYSLPLLALNQITL